MQADNLKSTDNVNNIERGTIKKKNKVKLINLKVSEDEFNEMKNKANNFTNGNLSQWIRYSATKLMPRMSDLE